MSGRDGKHEVVIGEAGAPRTDDFHRWAGEHEEPSGDNRGSGGQDNAIAAFPKIEDHYKWAFDQAAHIRAGRFDQVDILNVADEIESVGKSELRAVTSGVEITLIHILKWDFQPSKRSRSWELSIIEHRQRVVEDLKDNPSLRGRLEDIVGIAYRFARYGAARETKLSLKTFPESCPYSWAQIMEAPYELNRD